MRQLPQTCQPRQPRQPRPNRLIHAVTLSLLASAVLLGGCGDGGGLGTINTTGQWQIEKLTTLEGFNVPESVLVQPGTCDIYVSNIVAPEEGEGSEKYWTEDGTGYITKLTRGTLGGYEAVRWYESSDRVRLHSPKGLGITGGEWLWVADMSAVARLSLTGNDDAGPTGTRIDIPGAKGLNDIVTRDGVVYASDTFNSCIWRIDGDKITKHPAPQDVNGLAIHDNTLWAVSWSLHDIYSVDLTGTVPPVPLGVGEQFTNLDGIVALPDGKLIVSDFYGNALWLVDPDTKAVRQLAEIRTPADLGLDLDNMLLYVPQFKHKQVAVYKLIRP